MKTTKNPLGRLGALAFLLAETKTKAPCSRFIEQIAGLLDGLLFWYLIKGKAQVPGATHFRSASHLAPDLLSRYLFSKQG